MEKDSRGVCFWPPTPKDHHLSNSLFFPSPEPHAQPGHGHSISKSRDLVQCMKNYSGAVICRWIYWGRGGVKRASRSGPLPFRISVSALAHRRFMKFTIAVVKICSGPIPILIFFGSDRTLRQLPPLSGTPVYASHIFVAFSHPYSKVCETPPTLSKGSQHVTHLPQVWNILLAQLSTDITSHRRISQGVSPPPLGVWENWFSGQIKCIFRTLWIARNLLRQSKDH